MQKVREICITSLSWKCRLQNEQQSWMSALHQWHTFSASAKQLLQSLTLAWWWVISQTGVSVMCEWTTLFHPLHSKTWPCEDEHRHLGDWHYSQNLTTNWTLLLIPMHLPYRCGTICNSIRACMSKRISSLAICGVKSMFETHDYLRCVRFTSKEIPCSLLNVVLLLIFKGNLTVKLNERLSLEHAIQMTIWQHKHTIKISFGFSPNTRFRQPHYTVAVVGKTPVAVAAVSTFALQLNSRVYKHLPPGLETPYLYLYVATGLTKFLSPLSLLAFRHCRQTHMWTGLTTHISSSSYSCQWLRFPFLRTTALIWCGVCARNNKM